MAQPHPAPDYYLSVNGQDITTRINPRLISLTLTESREDAADTLELRLADHDGELIMPPADAQIILHLGYRGQKLVDKGTFKVDEVEHSGAPDELAIKASSANLKREMRQRAERSWHGTTVGAIVHEMAARNQLKPRVDAALSSRKVAHIDQTNESDVHFLTRLAQQHDAVATVKNNTLLFLPINATASSSGAPLGRARIVRSVGDQHRYHSAERGAYSGVRAQWHDAGKAQKRSVLAGNSQNTKTLKEIHATEANALEAAQSELQRIDRGKATFELNLALGRPELMPQTPVTVAGFKPEIDGTEWLVVKLTHSLGDGGLTTRLEMETKAAPGSKGGEVGDVDGDGAAEEHVAG